MMPEELKRVLSIDDDPNMSLILKKVFKNLPISFRAVEDPHAGILMAHEWQPDLLLLDLMLPEINGWEILDILRADPALPNLEVIVLTAKISEYDRLLGANVAKIAAYFPKPFRPPELRQQVSDVLWPS